MAHSNLTQLIHGLKTGEVQLIRNYYSSMVTLKDATKRLQLFDIIKSDKKATDEFASQKLYKCKPNSAYSQLKRRLKEDILNILLLQDSKRRFNSKSAQAEFDVRRLLIAGDILVSRGLTNEGVATLYKARKMAIEYELYNEIVSCCEVLISHLATKSGAKDYYENKKIIDVAIETNKKLLIAKDYYYKVGIPTLFKLNESSTYINFSREATKELEGFFSESKSAKVGYYYHQVATQYFSLIKNYKKALLLSKSFLDLVQKNKSIYLKRTIANAYFQIAYNELQLRNYNDCIKNTLNALKYFKEGLTNELLTIETLFLAHFYNNDAKKADQVLQRALTHPKLNSNKFLPAKWHYYKACYLFKQKKFNEANDAMSNCTYLLEDKTGWLYGYRILDIMITLECNEAFLVDSKVANFKKIIGKQKNINSSRAKTTLKILDTLVKRHYEYKLIYKSQKANILTLQEAKETHLWEPIGYELIRFEEWILGKINSSRLGPLDIMVTGTSK
jgi:hypothetical protein